MVTHYSILTWKISWTEELGGLESMGLKVLDMTEQQHWDTRIVLTFPFDAMYD